MHDPLAFLVTGQALRGQVFGDLLKAASAQADIELPAGSRLGPWEVVRVLGKGGMSTVYLAERADGQFNQLAAVKVVRPTLALVERLKHERQLLAELRHPSIIQLLDGGETDDGRLWLAMEPVFGAPIDEYVRLSRLEWKQRLSLLETVCDALSYAHGYLLIHRDIKPSNILVDELGRPKLLDFGIAILGNSADASDGALTPSFASPEQLAGGAVTTASDIHQTGQLIRMLMLPGGAPCTTFPRPPPRRIVADLGRILQKATCSDPSQRYASAAELGADLAALRERRPVSAGKRGSLYLLGCFFERHLAACLVAAALATVIAASWVYAFMQSAQARAAASRANLAAEFLNETLRDLNPSNGRRETPTELTAATLDRATERLARSTQLDAIVRGDLSTSIAEAYVDHRMPAAAHRSALAALEFYAQAGDVDVEARARALLVASRSAYYMAKFGDTIRMADQLLAQLRQAGIEDNLLAVRALHVRANAKGEAGKEGESLLDYRAAIALCETLGTECRGRLSRPMGGLGSALRDLYRWEESREVLERAIALSTQADGDDHPTVHWQRGFLAETLADMGELDLALEMARRGADRYTEIYGERSPASAQLSMQLGYVLLRRGEPEQALERILEAQAGYAAGDETMATDLAWSEYLAGRTYLALGRLDEATARCSKALDLLTAVTGSDTISSANAGDCLAATAIEAGDLASARKYATQVLAVRRGLFGDSAPGTLQGEVRLATIQMREGNAEAALQRARAAMRTAASIYAPGNMDYRQLQIDAAELERMARK